MKLISIAGIVKNCLYTLAKAVSARVVLLEGVPYGSTQPLRCLLIGEGFLHNYISSKFSHGSDSVGFGKRESFWRIYLRLKNLDRDRIDMCFVVAPRLIRKWVSKGANFQVFQAVGQKIATASWLETKKSFSSRKRTLANGLERDGSSIAYRISMEMKDFLYFYENMFKPHIIKKYSTAAIIESADEMLEHFRQGFLMLLEVNSVRVAGVLLIPKGRTLFYRRMGVLDGNEKLISEGIQSILYFLQIKYAADSDFDSIDLMLSAPFLSDGVYKNKAHWGGLPYGDLSFGPEEHLYFSRNASNIASFFRTFPMIVKQGSSLGVIAGLPEGTEADESWVKSFVKRHPVRGFNALIPVHPTAGLKVPISLDRFS